MFAPGDVISYIEMCTEEGASLQRGMNFHLRGGMSAVLMSLRRGAPYADQILENVKVLIYEGHDVLRTKGGEDPKAVDQPRTLPSGKLTQNGLFFEAAMRAKAGNPEVVKVYEKLHNGVWVFDGVFELLDAWEQRSGKRKVLKSSYRLLKLKTLARARLTCRTTV